ncbi:MAG: hypothetical protein RMJ67_05935 [Elusimicrobiota bacterium]|nr:hypothetical protein [Endomicrobiia bacterium]MDW8166032.1 hypothetical protein [Elusimicrobiota bacterium]
MNETLFLRSTIKLNKKFVLGVLVIITLFYLYLTTKIALNPYSYKSVLFIGFVFLIFFYFIPYKLFYFMLFVVPIFYFLGEILPDKIARVYELCTIVLPITSAVLICIKNRKLIYKWMLQCLFIFFIYVFIFLISGFVNNSEVYKIIQSFQFELRYFLIFLVFSIMRIKKERIIKILKILFVVLNIYLMSGYFYLILGRFLNFYGSFFINEVAIRGYLFGSLNFPFGRFFTPQGGHNMAGMFLVIGFLVFYILWKTDRENFYRITKLKSIRVWKWLMIIGILLTESKISFLCMVVGMWLTNYFIPRKKSKMFTIATIFVFLFLIIFLIMALIEIEPAKLPGFLKLMYVHSYIDFIQRGHDRPATYYFFFKILTQDLKTFLVGLGPGNFGLALVAYGVDVQKSIFLFEELKRKVGYNYLPGIGTLLDSNVVSLGGQIGFLGLILFFFIFLPIWVRAKKSYEVFKDSFTNFVCLVVIVIIPIFLLSGFTNTFWTVKPNALWFWTLCGISMAQINNIVFKIKNENSFDK